MKPMISIIMAVYNGNSRSMIQKCVDSILEQSFENWELIICDDGSTDGTYELLHNLYGLHEKITLLRNANNLGLAASLNKCINKSKGEYIARQDADDYSSFNRLERQLEFLLNNPSYGFVGSNAFYFDKNGVWGKSNYQDVPSKRAFLWNSPFIHPTVLFRRESLLQVDQYKVKKRTRRTEDYDLFMRMYARGIYGYNIQTPLFYYCIDESSIKRRKFRYRLDESIIRYEGYKELRLFPLGLIFTFKPLFVGLIPQALLAFIKRRFRKNGDQN